MAEMPPVAVELLPCIALLKAASREWSSLSRLEAVEEAIVKIDDQGDGERLDKRMDGSWSLKKGQTGREIDWGITRGTAGTFLKIGYCS